MFLLPMVFFSPFPPVLGVNNVAEGAEMLGGGGGLRGSAEAGLVR